MSKVIILLTKAAQGKVVTYPDAAANILIKNGLAKLKDEEKPKKKTKTVE